MKDLPEKVFRGACTLRGVLAVAHLYTGEAYATIVVGKHLEERRVTITVDCVVVPCGHLGSVTRGVVPPVHTSKLDANSHWRPQFKPLSRPVHTHALVNLHAQCCVYSLQLSPSIRTNKPVDTAQCEFMTVYYQCSWLVAKTCF